METVEPETPRRGARQALELRPRALVRAAVRGRGLHRPAARRVRRDGGGARTARRCCPTTSRSTCSSPSPIFAAIPQRLRLNSPAEVRRERASTDRLLHRHAAGRSELGDPAELAFAARATASFPGAFPPFTVGELDAVLDGARQRLARAATAFLARALPRHAAAGMADKAVLIDGSVLANAPFRPGHGRAARTGSARREIDRRFVYIDPKPGMRSDPPRSGGRQPSRPASSRPSSARFPTFRASSRSATISRRCKAGRSGSSGCAGSSTRCRTRWRRRSCSCSAAPSSSTARPRRGSPPGASRAQTEAARRAGYAYAAYGHLKLSGIVEELAGLIRRITPRGTGPTRTQAREAIWAELQRRGLDRVTATRRRRDRRRDHLLPRA